MDLSNTTKLCGWCKDCQSEKRTPVKAVQEKSNDKITEIFEKRLNAKIEKHMTEIENMFVALVGRIDFLQKDCINWQTLRADMFSAINKRFNDIEKGYQNGQASRNELIARLDRLEKIWK